MQLTKTQHVFIFTLTLCAALFLTPLSISAQVVNIPDANLRKAINEALDKAPNARITANEMATLRELHAGSMDIRNLTGLEAAVNLVDLNLHNNAISDISVLTGLTKLHHIGLEDNVITDLSPLEKLIDLRELHLGHNLIVDLSPLEGLINLRGISLHHNAISDLSPLAGLIRLEWIGMSHNPLADLAPLSGLTNLHNFHGWGTPVINLAGIAKLPKLREINICGGEIFDLSPLADAKGLRELYLPGNEVSDLSPLKGLTNLTRLSFEHNQISDLSPLEGLSNLTWIDLRDNDISDTSSLAELSNLNWLDLSQNAAITDVTPLASLPNLTWLGLAENAGVDTSQLERFSEKTSILHSDFVNSALPKAGPKIVGPWLWAIVPGAGVSNADLLEKVSKGAATEVKVATFGTIEDKPIGSGRWKAHRLSPIGGDNLNQMTDALGWGSGSEIYDHVIYGSVTLDSPRKQETTMLVGSDDGVKVWLNGEVVHYNPTTRGAGDYQDAFPVTLKQGTNVLLVAVDNRGHGGFSGFFGFAKDTDYTVNPIGKKFTVKIPAWDVNRDGRTDILDLIIVGQDFGKARAANARTDVNRDGKRNIADLVLVAQHLGELSGVSAAPAVLAIDSIGLDPAVLRGWIAQAEIENDGSLAFQQGIANLQQLLVLLIPEKTALLTNYPNPFNPETWIPYQLTETAEVMVCIYAVNGTLVRTLHLGHQPAGLYHQRSRAAYWDGKNELGESVASGVYFYSLTAGDFTATRKMLIRK